MIHYHGGPITPVTCAIRAWGGRHAFVSWHRPDQIEIAAQYSQSFALDNGAFAYWRNGKIPDWSRYYPWVTNWARHPGFDFAIIPDVIGGSEEENDELLAQWPLSPVVGVPVWHINESFDRFKRLAENWPRVAIGSCDEWDVSTPSKFLPRAIESIESICDDDGYPITKLHGLRLLNPKVFSKLPLSSADSTNVAQNIGIDSAWKGTYQPKSKETRTSIMVERIESVNSACRLSSLLERLVGD